jgi:hypothetical protein
VLNPREGTLAIRHELITVNEEIGRRESAGDKSYFESLLAEKFSMLRANNVIDDRDEYLLKLTPSAHRTTTLTSVSFIGSRRAVVTCIVEMGGKLYDNLRIFVRSDDKWQLLSWANEELSFAGLSKAALSL